MKRILLEYLRPPSLAGAVLLGLIAGVILSVSSAPSQTTVPTVQIVLSKASAERLYLGTDTAVDRENLRKAISLTRAIEIKPNPCHPPPSAVTEGRFPNNCSEPQGGIR